VHGHPKSRGPGDVLSARRNHRPQVTEGILFEHLDGSEWLYLRQHAEHWPHGGPIDYHARQSHRLDRVEQAERYQAEMWRVRDDPPTCRDQVERRRSEDAIQPAPVLLSKEPHRGRKGLS